jgi:hypothetical protein
MVTVPCVGAPQGPEYVLKHFATELWRFEGTPFWRVGIFQDIRPTCDQAAARRRLSDLCASLLPFRYPVRNRESLPGP